MASGRAPSCSQACGSYAHDVSGGAARGFAVSSIVESVEPDGVIETADAPDAPPRSRGLIGVMAILVVGAVVLRFWLAFGRLGRIPNSDEAVVGLMALHVLRHHEFRAFYWGQPYGGSLESILVAPFVAIFGTTTLGLRSASILLELLSAWLTWRIARRLFDARVAVWAGVLALWWPLALVWFGTQERGFYPLSVVLGMTTVLTALRIDDDPSPLRRWIGLGVAVGVGWWVSPDILYFAVPVLVWLTWRGHWRRWRGVAVAFGGFVFGSAVWIDANIHSHFASLRIRPSAGTSTFWSRFGFFWQTGLPFAFGFRRPWGGQWYWSPLIGRLCYAAVLLALAFGLRRFFRTRSLDLVLLGFAPLVFAFFPQTWLLSEGRYTYFVAALLVLVLCRVAQYRWGRPLLVALVVVTGVAFTRDYHRLEAPIAASVVPITRAIEHEGYHTAIANYWIAFRMTYQSDEHVIATPVPGQASVRYPPYLTAINNSTPAYVFNLRGQFSSDTRLTNALTAAHVPYRIVTAAGYYAVLPSRRFITVP